MKQTQLQVHISYKVPDNSQQTITFLPPLSVLPPPLIAVLGALRTVQVYEIHFNAVQYF